MIMKLHSLLEHLILYKYDKEDNPEIRSIEMDSREVRQGSLFFCIKGYTVDGHDFVDQAIENGAVAIIAERKLDVDVPVIIVSDSKRTMAILANVFYDHPTSRMQVVGVTGTNGKTTVTHMLERIFQDAGKKTGLIGTIHMKIGNETFPTKNTTPESLTLQSMFRRMADEKVDTALMEVSSHALDLGRVRGVDYDIAVFTNLSQDHLDYHRDMADYRRAKGLLFAQLGNVYDGKKKIAVLNNDDEASEEYRKSTAAQVITYGIEQPSDITAENIHITNKGTTFTLKTTQETMKVEMKLIGKFSVYNVLASVAAAMAAGLPMSTVKESIASIEGVDGRFEPVYEGQDFMVIVDYAHTPDSLENVLTTINQFAEGEVTVIVGTGGDRDRTKRPLMAKIAVEHSDYAIFTSDNPRSEDPEQILRDMEAGVPGGDYTTIVDRKEAIAHAVHRAEKGDVILIAGKGHETYQIIGDQVFDFDDRIVARNAIKERVQK